MRTLLNVAGTILIMAFTVACSSAGGAEDAADASDGDAHEEGDEGGLRPDGDDAWTGDEGGGGEPQDTGPRPDHDPSQSFLIEVPPGTSLCSTFAAGRSWQQELAMLGDIDLRPGTYVLPRQPGFHPAAFVETLRFGPDATEVPPTTGEGEFNAVYRDWGSWSYVYSEEFEREGVPYRVEVTFSFRATDGNWPAEQVFDLEFMSQVSGRLFIGPAEDWLTENQVFSSCQQSDSMQDDIVAVSEGGDQARLVKKMCRACMCPGMTGCFFLAGAKVELGGAYRFVQDPFSLVYSAIHHNDEEKFLVLLEPAAGDASALLVLAPPRPATEGGYFVYLDENMDELRRETMVDWQSSW
jgi:hypothetical protein